ncbi:MAG: 1,4-alpha-glucan branching protein GlgB [Gemmatimonadaceae bacterium]
MPSISQPDVERLLAGVSGDPHAILGAHEASAGKTKGVVVRGYHPDAISVDLVLETGASGPMRQWRDGLFTAFLPGATLPFRYQLRFKFANDESWTHEDPYRFLPTIGETDLYLFNEGTHHRLWEVLGAHPRTIDGVDGTSFAVWAPNAMRVSVVGDFCAWDGRLLPMRTLGSSGIWELFVPGVGDGAIYKYEIRTSSGATFLKTDPFAFKLQQFPGTGSIVVRTGTYTWGDNYWSGHRRTADITREPVLIYEVHAGSWAHTDDGTQSLTYREMAPRLAEHATSLGFTHIEFLPIAEHPFAGSWGYQVTGYFAPTSRFGTPDDFRFLVDTLHRAGIGVILDWVPAHFPKDDVALSRFDGTALYEHADPRLGEHPDWGTLIFNFGRTEVRNFLVANALYWMNEFHIDGLRVDAVASMLYLDYSRKAGEWVRNRLGGRENLEAVELLRAMNTAVASEHPGNFTVAEESTAWPGVTRPVAEGGLGFTFKWNMGWMHDTLEYFATDPIHRSYQQGQLTFAMVYEYSERFIMPLSHDEVVHLKRSLLEKMPGDEWQRFANLRLLLAYQYTRPGKKLLFMGTELAPTAEWNHDLPLDWNLGKQPMRARFAEFMTELGKLYHAQPELWRDDYDPSGFAWIDVADTANSIVSYVRRSGNSHLVVVLNLTPVPRENYWIGVPGASTYRLALSTDDTRFGGSGYQVPDRLEPQPTFTHGFPQSIALTLPPLGALVLVPEYTGDELSSQPVREAHQ